MNEKLYSIINKLKEKNIDFKIIELTKMEKDNTEDKLNHKKNFKTLVVKKENNSFFAMLLPVDKKIDLKKLEKRFNSKLNLASYEEIKNVINVEPGAVCPLDLNIPLIIDNSVFRFERINIGSGDQMYGIEVNPRDILKITNAKTSNVT